MEEKDLQGLWNHSGEKASDYYGEIEGEVLRKAKSQSHSILQKVRRNIIKELVASAVAAVAFPFFIKDNAIIFWLTALVMALAMGFTLKVYLGYLKDIKQINDGNVVTGLEKKARVLSGYIKQVITLVYIFAPIGFMLGLAMTAADHGFTFNEEFGLNEVIIQFVIGIPFLFVTFWGFKKYIHWLYGRHLQSLNELLDGLKG